MTNVMCHINNKLYKKERKIMTNKITRTERCFGQKVKCEYEFNTDDLGYSETYELDVEKCKMQKGAIDPEEKYEFWVSTSEFKDFADCMEKLMDSIIHFSPDLKKKTVKIEEIYPEGRPFVMKIDGRVFQTGKTKCSKAGLKNTRERLIPGKKSPE